MTTARKSALSLIAIVSINTLCVIAGATEGPAEGAAQPTGSRVDEGALEKGPRALFDVPSEVPQDGVGEARRSLIACEAHGRNRFRHGGEGWDSVEEGDGVGRQ